VTGLHNSNTPSRSQREKQKELIMIDIALNMEGALRDTSEA
jgi:folylpolyglutamate synthase/dihydropteroate synthase